MLAEQAAPGVYQLPAEHPRRLGRHRPHPRHHHRRGAEMTWPPFPFPVERYCVISGRPVSMIPGDRCVKHGDADRPCDTDVRPAECTHPHPSPNHPYPHCSECGRDLAATPTEGTDHA